MVHIEELLELSRNNHYKLLTLVGSEEKKKEEIINYLSTKGWEVYDVEEVILELTKDLPKEKIGLRLGKRLKMWVKKKGDKIVLDNTSILFSPELKQKNPVESFHYRMRGDREGVLFLEGKLRDDTVIYSTPDKNDFDKVDVSKIVVQRITEVEIGGASNEN